jgi:hypothetical protein
MIVKYNIKLKTTLKVIWLLPGPHLLLDGHNVHQRHKLCYPNFQNVIQGFH